MTRRNNADRFGAPNVGLPMPMMGQEQRSPVPTEFVELPSKGRLYPPGHPLHNKEEVEIRFMTAKDEDILSSITLIKKGIMLDRFIQSILVDKSIDPQELYTGDRNAILIAARITGYGSEYTSLVRCPSCGEQSKYEFDLGEYGIKNSDSYINLGLTITSNGTYALQLPKTGVNIEIRLLNGKTEKYLNELAESKRKNNIAESPITDQLKMVIYSVDGDTSRSRIESFVDNMPAYDSKHLRKVYTQIIPNVDMTKHFTCPKCANSTDVEVPLTAEFFWSN